MAEIWHGALTVIGLTLIFATIGSAGIFFQKEWEHINMKQAVINVDTISGKSVNFSDCEINMKDPINMESDKK